MKDFQRILVLQTAFLGDVILSTPLIRALQQTYPGAEIDILTIPETAMIYKFNPHISQQLLFNKRKLIPRIFSFCSLLYRIRQRRYDLAVSIQTSLTSSLLMYITQIPVRLGFPRQKLLTTTIELRKGIQVVKRTLMLMSALTEQTFDIQTELFWNDATEKSVQKYIEKYQIVPDKTIGIAPGSIWNTKKWLKEYFARLISLLHSKGYRCILIGGRDDVHLCDEIITRSQTDAVNLAGKLSLLGSAALINQLRLLVSNDSAPLHLANAVQTDVVAIFGPTDKSLGFFPFRDSDKVVELSLPCRPCGRHGSNKCPLGHFKCMKDISPELVFASVNEVLEKQCKPK